MAERGKKLLLVSTSFPLKPGDGLSPFMLDLCRHLSCLGWDVTALVPHHRGLPEQETWDDIKVRRFHYLPEPFEDIGYSGGIMPNLKSRPWSIIKLPFYIFGMYREALKMAVEENFDLVNFHWFFPPAFWMGQFIRSSGVPVIMTGHGTDIHLAAKGIFKWFADRAFRRVSAVTVNSEYMKGILKNAITTKRLEVVFIGADKEKFKPLNNRPSDSRTILYVGRLIRQKGIDLLVESFVELKRAYPEARLEIIGYGPEKKHIQEILKSHNIFESVSFSDTIPHDRLPEVYRRARVLVLPSLIPEGLGLTPAEAGLCGVPTVTFGLGGTSEIVVDGVTGLITEPRQGAFTDALKLIFADDALADKLGQNAREHLVGIIAWEKVAAKFDSLFQEVVKAHGTRFSFSKGNAGITAFLLLAVTFGYIIKTFIDRFERIASLFK